MGNTFFPGMRKFITEKMLFLISPAYWLPAMTTSLRLKDTRMAASELMPSSSG